MKGNLDYHIFIPTGSAYEPKELNGISHFLEHIISGSNLYRDKIIPFLDKHDIYEDIGTSECFISFGFTSLKQQNLSLLRKKILSLLGNVEVNEEVFQREKDSIKEEVAYLQSFSSFVIDQEFRKCMFSAGSFSRPILGSLDTINNMSLGALIKWHNAHYFKKQILEITYDRDSDNLKILSEPTPEILGKIPSVDFTKKNKERNILRELPSSFIRVGWGVDNPSLKERAVLDILAGMLKGTGNSFISTDLQKPGLVYEGTVDTDHFRKVSFLLVNLVSTRKDLVFEKIRKYLSAISQSEIDEKIFSTAKKREYDFYTTPDPEKPIIVGEEYISTGELVLPKERVKVVEEITTKDIVEITQRIIDNGSCKVVVE